MKIKTFLFIFIPFFLCAFLFSKANSKNDQSGTSGLSFLKLGGGARSVGMGEAYCAQSREVASPFWNPAAIAGGKETRISLTHLQWFQDITAEYLSFVTGAGENTFGLSLSLGKVADIQKRGEVPTAEPLALFEAHDVVFSFSYARDLTKICAIGVSIKWIYERIDIASASGLGLDFGGIFSPFARKRDSTMQGLRLGAAVLNLGAKMKFEEKSFNLPTLVKAGLSYTMERKRLKSEFTLGLDVVKPRDDEVKLHLGGEVALQKMLKLRLGYQLGYEEKDLSFGLGIRYRNCSLDYAFLPYGSGFDDLHCISLNVAF